VNRLRRDVLEGLENLHALKFPSGRIDKPQPIRPTLGLEKE